MWHVVSGLPTKQTVLARHSNVEQRLPRWFTFLQYFLLFPTFKLFLFLPNKCSSRQKLQNKSDAFYHLEQLQTMVWLLVHSSVWGINESFCSKWNVPVRVPYCKAETPFSLADLIRTSCSGYCGWQPCLPYFKTRKIRWLWTARTMPRSVPWAPAAIRSV